MSTGLGSRAVVQLLNRMLAGRIFVGLAAITGIAVFGAACGGAAQAPTTDSSKTWEISVVTDLSGPLNLYGTSELGGLQTWVDHVNKTGGVSGRKIALKIHDDRSDVQAGLAQFKEALTEKPLVLIGPFVSSLAVAAVPLAEQAGVNVILWTPVSTLLNPPQPHIFGAGATLDQMARIQAGLIGQLAKGQTDVKVVVTRLDSASGVDFSNAAKSEISKRGWKLVGEQKVSLTATDVSDQAAAMVKTGADYCLCETFGPANLQLMRGLRNNGSKMVIVNYWGGGIAADMLALNDPNYYAVLVFADPTTGNLPAAETMREHAKAAGQEKYMVNYAFTQGYVVGMVVTQALQKCGTGCDADKFRAALKSTKYSLGDLAGPATLSSSQYIVQSGRAFRVVNKVITSYGDWRSQDD